MAEGGYAEAVVRMMILLAQARGGVRRDRLRRSSAMLRETEPFASMTPEARQALIRTQTVICAMSPTEALETLPKLLPTGADRRRALAAVEGVAGPEEDLGESAVAMLRRIRTTLGDKGVAGRAGTGGRTGGGVVPVPFHAAAIPSD
jgi:tellurite resistance protein